MSNICAGIGRGQMIVLPERIQKRRENYAFYLEQLSSIDGISFLFEPNGFFSNRWLSCILVDPSKTNGVTREDIRTSLEKLNIECRPLWKPMHLQPIFEHSPYYGNQVAEGLFEKGLCLPSGSNLERQDLEAVVEAIKACLK